MRAGELKVLAGTLRRRVSELLRLRIWDPDPPRVSPLQRFAFRQLRVAVIFIRGLTSGRIQLHASGLTYTTLLSLGPILVLALSVIQGFGALEGLQDKLEDLLIDNLSPGSQDQVRAWLYKFFDSVRSGAFRGISALVLVGGVIGLLMSLERAFNDIWGVHRGRSVFQRISTYTTLVVLGPLLVGVSVSLTASLETSALRSWVESLSPVSAYLSQVGLKLVPALCTGLAFTLLYAVMPNVRVRLRAALPAGLVAGVLWELTKHGYGAYIKTASHYGTFYGSLAAVPFFLIWVYVSWLVVLFGGQLAFARDAAKDLRLEEGAFNASPGERLQVALHLAVEAARCHRYGRSVPEIVELSQRLHLPLRLVRGVAEELVDGGILHLVQLPHRESGLAPARAPERISVYEIFSSMVQGGGAQQHGQGKQQALHGTSSGEMVRVSRWVADRQPSFTSKRTR